MPSELTTYLGVGLGFVVKKVKGRLSLRRLRVGSMSTSSIGSAVKSSLST